LVKLNQYIGLGANEELFDTIVVIENYPLDKRLRESGGNLTPQAYAVFEMTHYDLTVAVSTFGEIVIDLLYNPVMLEKERIEEMAEHFRSIVEAVVENPGKKVHQLEMLSQKEKQRLLVDFNSEASGYTANKTITQLFEEQVAKTPGNEAVTGKAHRAGLAPHCTLTFEELKEKSTEIARYLQHRGVGENGIVGILTDRTVEMIIGILGILKTGGAYLPLNPKAPVDRNKYMLDECNAEQLVTVGTMAAMAGEIAPGKEIVYLDGKNVIETGKTGEKEDEELTQAEPSGYAYIIFTSGSTGKPKGVPITHTNLSPLLHWGYKHLGIGPRDRAIQNLSYYFDWSV
ncbi:MAG: AMP-binding protein, partial [bacterium]|nr:AMP-binding protein [bacterium]